MKKLLFLLVFPLCPLISYAQDDAPEPTPAATTAAAPVVKVIKVPTGYTAQLDVVYKKVGDWNGRMDLYLPPKTGKPSAIIINIHGGGWNHGAKEAQSGFNSFFKKGMGVANIEYRLKDTALAPAGVEDCRCALLYLIRNAKELNIDPERIVVMGSSAGGHLALLTGLLANDHAFDNECPGVKKVKVAAIIDKFGLADAEFAVEGRNNTKKDNSFIRWMGANAKDPQFVKSMSPITYINKKSPPVFIVHGDADPRIPYQQSVTLNEQLEKAGVEHTFMTVPGGVHGNFPEDQKQLLNTNIMEFLVKHKIIE